MQNEVQIRDELGEILKIYRVPVGKILFECVNWEGVLLYGAQLAHTNFKGANLYSAGFFMAQLDGANFENANLQGVNLRESSCVGASFRGANLGRNNLSGSSQLQGADFTGAILNHAKLEGAEFDENTKFPKDFHPKSHGMIEIECSG